MKNSKRISRIIGFTLTLITATVLFLSLAPTVKADSGTSIGTAVCTARSTMNLRSGPSTSNKVVAKLPGGTTVQVYAISGSWYKVNYNGTVAWGHKSYLSYTAGAAASPSTSPVTVSGPPIGRAVCIASSSLKLRTGPSTSYKSAGKLPARTFVDVYAISGKWYQIMYNGALVWGSSSYLSYAPYPAAKVAELSATSERTYTIYYQGDSRWKFSSSVRKKACVISAYSITINNMGIPANPRFIYESNGRKTTMNIGNLKTNFGVVPVSALDADSAYLKSFDGRATYVVNPGTNGIAAIKEAIDNHPEGVICYFKRGSEAHAVVACRYEGDIIYYSDPGRTRTTLLTFENTWVSYSHHMKYSNLVEIVALDTVAETLAPKPSESEEATPTATP